MILREFVVSRFGIVFYYLLFLIVCKNKRFVISDLLIVVRFNLGI